MKRWILGAAALLALLAIALPEVALAASRSDEGRSCFFAKNVSSWSAAGRDKVNLRVGVNDYYQLNLLGTCPDIDWTQSIGLESRGSDWICSGLDVTVIVPRTTIGPQRCQATALHKLTAAEVAALPKKQKP
jgi:hypothetical protein